MRTYRIHTEADTRSRSRMSRDWTIKAESENEARDEAKDRHQAVCGWNCGVWTSDVEELS